MQALIKKNKIYRKEFKSNEINYYINSILKNNKLITNADKEILDYIGLAEKGVSAITLSATSEGVQQNKVPQRNNKVTKASLGSAEKGAALPKSAQQGRQTLPHSPKGRGTSPKGGTASPKGKGGKAPEGATPISKIRNICVLTGRTRALIQDYKLSRLKFKELAEIGYIPGVKKL